MRWRSVSLPRSRRSVISKNLKKSLLIFVAALAAVACGGNAPKKAAVAETQVAPDMHTAETSLDYLGTYEGTLPAADCPGIRTTLTLKPDGTYDLHMEYIDRNAGFDETGVFTVRENLLTLTLLDDGSEAYYKVEENRLRMLDAEKQPAAGPSAEKYVLHKNM